MNQPLTQSPEIRAFSQRCQQVRAEVEKRIADARHPKPAKARTHLWCYWLRKNGFMGVSSK